MSKWPRTGPVGRRAKARRDTADRAEGKAGSARSEAFSAQRRARDIGDDTDSLRSEAGTLRSSVGTTEDRLDHLEAWVQKIADALEDDYDVGEPEE